MCDFESNFPNLKKLMAGYLNMDAVEMTGSKELKGMVEYYTTRVSKKSLEGLLKEINLYVEVASKLGDLKFEDVFDYGFDVGDEDQFFETVKAVVRKKLEV